MKSTTNKNSKQQAFYFKSCPRCKGDMRRGSDYFGAYASCQQCGYHVDVYEPTEVIESPDLMSGNYQMDLAI